MASEMTSMTLDTPWFLQGGGEAGALLRAIDWQSHPLGPPNTWPVIVQATTSIMLGSRQPMFMAWGPQHHTIYNDGYAAMCGKRHPASMGEPLSVIWYDIWDVVEDLVRRVHRGESIHMDDIAFVMYRNGYPEETHFGFSYNPMRDEHGNILGVFCTCDETTEKVLLRQQLDHERNMLAQLFDQSPSFVAKYSGKDHVFQFVNASYRKLVSNRDVIGKTLREAFPEIEGQGFIELMDQVYQSGEPHRIYSTKVQLQLDDHGPLQERFLDVVYQPVRSLDGVIEGILAEGVDVTDRVQSTVALKASEQFLRSVLKATPDCVKVLDLKGRLDFISEGGRLTMEIPPEHEIKGAIWSDFWAEAEKPAIHKAVTRAVKGQSSGFQASANTFAGNPRYWDVRVAPMLDANGQPERILAVSRDITYLKRIEDEREHLMRELAHRLKNAFAMVQSVINQTLRKAPSVDAARETLTGRVRALADAQNILTRSITDKMELHDVVATALAPHRSGEGRFRIDGPSAVINGKQGLGLSLALHELATNATKYGALANPEGHVAVTWSADKAGRFVFDWHERHGPPVTAPQNRGFGSVLIESIVATYFDGTASLTFPQDGVVFRLAGKLAPPEDTETPDPY